ncbi:MAG TPA: heme-binding protein [Vicinamibacterales bacterium]|nr:heme-binding protein [Vicinamibacterales bacterium]
MQWEKRAGVVLLALAACGCGSPSQSQPSPATTQPGVAAEAARQPRPGTADAACGDLPSASDLKSWLQRAPAEGGEAGGLFSGKMEWAAVVDRKGEVCATAVATDDPAAAWPGSQAIAKAKAYTANAFSTDAMPLSTARLYTLTQPGHSLWGLASSNTFNPDCLASPDDASASNGKVCGGIITFGGGVPLYRNNTRVGGLGVSGDTACADHEIAKRVRHLASLDPPKGEFVDDIQFSEADGPSVFTHPLCANTWRNGKKIGEEAKAEGY